MKEHLRYERNSITNKKTPKNSVSWVKFLDIFDKKVLVRLSTK